MPENLTSSRVRMAWTTGWAFIGHDERGVQLEVIAIAQPNHLLVIHVMPYAYRTRRQRDE